MKEKKIIPRGEYVLVRQEAEASRESEHGLLIPNDVEQEQKARGIVVDVGKKITDIKKGEDVVYGTYAGENISLLKGGSKVKYKLLHSDDVIAWLE